MRRAWVGVSLAVASMGLALVIPQGGHVAHGDRSATPAPPVDDDPAPTPTDEVAPEVAPDGDPATPSEGLAGPPPPADPAARLAWLTQRLDGLYAAPWVAQAQVGAIVLEANSGEVVWALAPDRGLNLASNAKVLTSAAALHVLGPAHRFATTALVRAADFDPARGVVDGDLWLRGGGDPTLTMADLTALAVELRQRGVRRIDGRLRIDDTLYDSANEPPHYDEQPLERAAFRAPISALMLAGNAVTVVVEPDPAGVEPAQVRVEPAASPYVQLATAEVTTIVDGRTRIRVSSRAVGGKLELKVTGQIRASDGAWAQRRRIDDPIAFVGDAWRAALDDQGIAVVARRVERSAAPPGARVLARHTSGGLAEIIRWMNKASSNPLADATLRALGAASRAASATPGPSTWADGQAAIRTYLTGCGVTGDFRVDNGSGLFDATMVSARQLATVLRCARDDFRVAPDFIASLPSAGVDGTLARRLLGTPAVGRVRAKTGTLAQVSSLAGYVGVRTDRQLVFALVFNGLADGGRPQARQLQDQTARALVDFLEATP